MTWPQAIAAIVIAIVFCVTIVAALYFIEGPGGRHGK